MDNKASITALMSSFGRAFHAGNEEHPVFADHLAKNLMTEEEYTAVQGYILGGAQFFEPEIAPAEQTPKELLRQLINTHIAPSPLCRAQSKLLRAMLYYITIAFLLLDPLYLSVLCGFFGGGDMNGIAFLCPEWEARCFFSVLLFVNGVVFWKRVLPAYRQSFSGR